jgi:hypothetical protein
MTKSLRSFLEAVRVSLCKLNEIQFSAPWHPERRGC